MLDFPQFTKDTFPGVTHMDLFSGLFGDVTDDSMFAGRTFDPRRRRHASGSIARRRHGEDRRQVPAHLQQRADQSGRTGGGGPQGRCRDRQEVARGCAVLGVKSMRMNSTSALGPGIRPNAISADPATAIPATSTSSRC